MLIFWNQNEVPLNHEEQKANDNCFFFTDMFHKFHYSRFIQFLFCIDYYHLTFCSKIYLFVLS